MTIWWKIGIFLSLLAINDAFVWRIHTWHDGYVANRALQLETQATKDAMKASDVIDTSFSESVAHLHQLEMSATQTLEATHEAPSAHCRISPERLSVLDTAITAGVASR